MNILPSLTDAKKIAAAGQYKVLPVSCEILSDICTPIEAVRILKNVSTHCYLLESAHQDEKWGRYTFLGFDPKLAITCENGKMRVGNLTFETENPSASLRQILADYKSPRFDYLPSFTGGLVGYFSYDYLGYSEPAVRTCAEDTEGFKDADLMLFDKVIAFDNFRQKIILIVNMSLEDVEVVYNKAVLELGQLENLLKTGQRKAEPGGRLLGEAAPLFDRERFCAMVETAKGTHPGGDIFQIVLSNRLSAPFEGSLLNTYRILRTLNPSPYMFYFSGTDVEVAGASPETLVKLENGVLHTFPLAGTRPRGRTDEEDKALEAELLSDSKELAEHNMLVDLGRNDLGKISRFGTVQVESLHSIERFSMSCTSAPRCGEKSGRTATPWTPSRRSSRRGRSPAPRKSGPASSLGSWKIISGASTAGPSAILILQEIWTSASPSVLPTRKTGMSLCAAGWDCGGFGAGEGI